MRITLTVPGQQGHHSGDDADKIKHGVGHLVLEDPVWIGWRVTGNADGAVGERYDEIQRHAAKHDHPVHYCLQGSDKTQLYICIFVVGADEANYLRDTMILYRNRHQALTQVLISIDRCTKMVNKETVFKGVPKVKIPMSESM